MIEHISHATLSDVAKRAGVSVATASRVLSNSEYPVKTELKKKVIKAASELNYIPNIFGQMLKKNVSNVIGVIVPSLQNPFYNQSLIGIEAAASKEGYEIRLLSSHRIVSHERSNITALLHSRVMSLIVFSIDDSPDTLKYYMENGGKVALLEADFELKSAIRAQTDSYSAGKIAARHLIDAGHRSIAFVTSPLTKRYRKKVLSGVKYEFEQRGLLFSDKDIFIASMEAETSTGQYEFEIGKILARKVLESKRKYTAIIAINDVTAYGVIQAVSQSGLSVPGDISVIGFDNIMYSEMISPPLTTVELPSVNMGFAACQLLITANSQDNNENGMEFSYPCILRVRKSTQAIHDS